MSKIPERYMVTGKRIDNGKMVKGAYFIHHARQLSPIGDEIKDGDILFLICVSGFADWNMPKPMQAIEVDPKTVEPIAVKVKAQFQSNDGEFAGHCPNCDKNVHSWTGEYCPACGQRLNWGI